MIHRGTQHCPGVDKTCLVADTSVPAAFRDHGWMSTVDRIGSLRSLESRHLIAAILISAGYYVGVHVGFSLTFAPSPVSIFWPPNAILLAGLLLTPPRTWCVTIAAVLPAHFAAEVPLGIPWANAASWFVSNVAEALLGAAMIVGYLRRAPHFDRVRDLSVFLVFGVLVAPVLSSFLDAAFVAMIGWRYTGFLEVWRIRLPSNAIATLTLVPLIGIWYRRRRELLRRDSIAQAVEAAALLTGLSVTSAVVFLRIYSPGFEVLMYVPLPFLIWAATRFGVSGVSLCAAIVAAFAIAGAQRGRGPFASTAPETVTLAVQVFLIIAESSLMLLAASLTELVQARKAAARQKERLKLALDAAEMGTWEWDAREDRVTWLPTREGVSGNRSHSRPRSLGRLLRLVHEDDRGAVDRAMNDALFKSDGREVEFRFAAGHGSYRWITGKGQVLTDPKDTSPRIIGVYIDITQRKAQEMQTRAQREQLAHLGRVSTLGELSAAIAHELSQPLNAILLNAQGALYAIRQSAPSPRELTRTLERIVSEDKRAGEVIRRLRALLLRGKTEMTQLDVNDCILEVLRLEHTDLVARQVSIDVRLEDHVPDVIGDLVQLQQVLLNLIVNARDAMADSETGDRNLQVTSRKTEDGIHVQVCDSGHGIKDTEAIFEPFFSTKDHGIGMGLSICRSIITSHGGRLWASNNAGRGATFHICLPAAPAGAAHTLPGAVQSPDPG